MNHLDRYQEIYEAITKGLAATAQRNEIIYKQVVERGLSLAQVAAIWGVTRGRIQQIAKAETMRREHPGGKRRSANRPKSKP